MDDTGAADPLTSMSPAAQAWFRRAFEAPTPAQVGAWSAIAAGEHTLVIAPTGSGKTLAAFFSALDRLATEATPDTPHRTRVLYISPLKALAVDVQRNLRAPLAGLRQESARTGHPEPDIRIGVRTGDTPPAERRRLVSRPPDILITTPESLFLLLTSSARESLRSIDTVIIDEIHAVAGTKRGAHLALSLERLEELLDRPAQRIGLSATVRPPEEVARFLTGGRPARVVEAPVDKDLLIDVVVPVEDMTMPEAEAAGAPSVSDLDNEGTPQLLPEGTAQQSIWPHVEAKVLDLIEEHTSTLVFANSRRLAERLTGRLNELASERTGTSDVVARAHHGSVSKEQRGLIEEDLKAGRLPAVVATSSLELGIDMGAIDLVVQVESPPSVASGLQRVGRAGHQVGAASKGIIFPKFRGDLVQSAVVSTMMTQRRIEALTIPQNPLDVLAQQVIAAVSMDEWEVGPLLDMIRRSAPFAELPDSAYEAVLDLVSGRYPSDEFAELRPRVVWNRQSGTLTARPGAQRLAVTSGGTIPDRGLFGVFLVGAGTNRVGELDEEMVYESRIGDVFALGASSWRIEEITHDRVLVSPAPGQPGRMPFWHGDTLGRSAELGAELGAFVRQTADSPAADARGYLAAAGLDDLASTNLLTYLSEQRAATGRLPDDRTVIIERFRDELGDWQVVIHSPFGARVHAPWALAIGSRLRASLGMDVSVFHADDGVVLRIADTDDPGVWATITDAVLVDPDEIVGLVTEELGGSALFAARFRECAARALLLPKRDPGKRAPLWQQRQRSAQLLSVASRYATFPIVLETVRECMQDIFDISALQEVLTGLDSGRIRLHECETARPSPFATSLLFGYVAAYLYEGDSPLAERRAQALTLDAGLLAELLGETELRDLLDPGALEAVEAEVAWLTPERRLRDAEAVADALRVLGPMTPEELTTRGASPDWIAALVDARRAIRFTLAGDKYAAIEDSGRLRDALGVALPVGIPHAFTEPVADPLGDLISRYARTHGPFTTSAVAAHFGIGPAVAAAALTSLAERGRVSTGQFRPGGSGTEWCDAEVLRRIRRRSVAALRAQAEPVCQQAYADFLPAWQHLRQPERGAEGLLRVIEQLAGAPLAASTLETLVLPGRIVDYSPAMLDELTSSGEVLWAGAGSLPHNDGWLVFTPSDLPELLPLPTEVAYDLANAVLTELAGGGGWFLHDITARLGQRLAATPEEDEMQRVMLDLMWAGLVTNDSLSPVRRGRVSRPRQRTTPRTRRAGGRYPRPPRREVAALPGRWSIVDRSHVDPTVRATSLVTTLLDRHGVLTRSAMGVERMAGGFAAAYRVLTAMEETGSCIRTYAIEGLGAAQFTRSSTVDRLRASADRVNDHDEAPIVLAATDPAQPYGAALPWPQRVGQDISHRPGRKSGAVVVLRGGDLVAYLERGGRSLLTWGSPDPEVLSALADEVRRGRIPSLNVQRVNGEEAQGSSLAAALVEAGFRLTPRGLRLRSGTA